MSLFALTPLVVLGGLAVLVLGLVRRSSARSRMLLPAGEGGPAPARVTVLVGIERTQLVWRWTGLAVGLCAAVGAAWAVPRWSGDDHGRSLLLVPAVVGLGVVAGVLGGDRHVRPPASSERSAGLVRRRLRDYLPRRLTFAVALTVLVLGAVLAMTTHLGSLDVGTGRAGGTLTLRCLVQGSVVGSSSGPWLGRCYRLPVVVALAVVLAVAAAGSRSTVLRPRATTDAGDRAAVDADERLRRRSTEALVAGCGVVVAATLLLAAPLTAMAMGSTAGRSVVVRGHLLPSCAPAWWSAVRWSLVGATPLALVVLVWCTAVVLVPTRRHDVTDVAAGQR